MGVVGVRVVWVVWMRKREQRVVVRVMRGGRGGVVNGGRDAGWPVNLGGRTGDGHGDDG